MVSPEWALSVARVGSGVLAAAVVTAIVVAPHALSDASGPSTSTTRPVATAEPLAPAAADIARHAAIRTADAGSAKARDTRVSRAATRSMRAVRQASYAHFTLRSAATTDMRGVERSLYRGRYFHPRAEEKRLCIVRRESEGHYDVVNPGGNYFGAYQVSRPLARGVTYMLVREHRDLVGPDRAQQILADLRRTPMNEWPRYWQDAAFHTIMNWEGPLSGASHWAGGRWTC